MGYMYEMKGRGFWLEQLHDMYHLLRREDWLGKDRLSQESLKENSLVEVMFYLRCLRDTERESCQVSNYVSKSGAYQTYGGSAYLDGI